MYYVNKTYIVDITIKITILVLVFWTGTFILKESDHRETYQKELSQIRSLQMKNQKISDQNSQKRYHLQDKDIFSVDELNRMVQAFLDSQTGLIVEDKSITQNRSVTRNLLIDPSRDIFVYEVQFGFLGQFLDLKIFLNQLLKVQKLLIIKYISFDAKDFPVNRAKVVFYVFTN